MSAAETPEQALASAVRANTAPGDYCPRFYEADALRDLRTAGWDVIRTPPDLARIREQAFTAGIAFAEEGHAAGQGRATVRGIAP